MNTIQRMKNWVDENQNRIMMEAPEGYTSDQIKRLAAHLVQADGKSEGKLSECTPASIASCILKAAHLDIALDLKEAYLIPYWNKHTQSNEAELRFDYKGLIKLAKSGGECVDVSADVVRPGDHFIYRRTENTAILEHEPEPWSDEAIVGVYAIFTMREGPNKVERMSKGQVDKVRSKASNGSFAWADFYNEMAKKAVIRRGMKTITLSPKANEALAASDAREYDFSDEKTTRSRDLNEMFSPKRERKELEAQDVGGDVLDMTDEREREAVPASNGAENQEPLV